MLPSTGQGITLGMLFTTLVFLLVMNLDIRVSQEKELLMSKSTTRIPKPEIFQSASKLEEKKSEPEKELSIPGLQISESPLTQGNKLETCKPKTNVVFVKTFKTGGSTLTNILGRFAMKNNLSFNGLGLQGLKLNHSTLANSNIISDHIWYNRTKLSEVMPKDTFYMTQLRQPLAQLISRLNFRGYSNVADPVEKYKKLKDFGGSKYLQFQKWDPWIQLDIPQNLSSKQFQYFLGQLENELDLVTVTEQFDLSLLLLRRKLCWDISDMIYLELKKADYRFNNNSALLNGTNKQRFDKSYQLANPNAYSLYKHFNKTLHNSIIQEGSELQEEFIFFQELRENVSIYCSRYIENITLNPSNFSFHLPFPDILYIPASRWGNANTVDPIECAMMKLNKGIFQDISTVKVLNRDLLLKHIGNVTNKETKDFYFSMTEPIHPKYGIPLPVLNQVHAYDLEEGVLHAQRMKARARKGILDRIPFDVLIYYCAETFNETMVPWLPRDFKEQANENPLAVPNHAHPYDFDDVGHPPEGMCEEIFQNHT